MERTKTFHTAQREFCANLRMLCSYYRSVADVCRKLNINRAQFNRYLIERTFPAGALAGLDATAKARVNANNASVGVSWIKSFANADRTKTYCVYEGPSEDAIRQAAALNNLPVDSVTEVPVDLTP